MYECWSYIWKNVFLKFSVLFYRRTRKWSLTWSSGWKTQNHFLKSSWQRWNAFGPMLESSSASDEATSTSSTTQLNSKYQDKSGKESRNKYKARCYLLIILGISFKSFQTPYLKYGINWKYTTTTNTFRYKKLGLNK